MEAANLKEALKNKEDYFRRETVERLFVPHQITIYQVAKTLEVDLQDHIAKWIQQYDAKRQQNRDQQEREEFERLKQKFAND